MRDMFFMDSKGDVPRVCCSRRAGGFPRPCAVRDMFFMDSKGDVLRVFRACVLHASGTNPVAVRSFGHESCCCSRLSQAVLQGHVP